jgi:hypothetical protein
MNERESSVMLTALLLASSPMEHDGWTFFSVGREASIPASFKKFVDAFLAQAVYELYVYILHEIFFNSFPMSFVIPDLFAACADEVQREGRPNNSQFFAHGIGCACE